MFTDRFIEVPALLISNKEAELYGEENVERIPWKTMLNPFDISYFRAESDEETLVYLKGGEDLMIALSISEFEKVLNSYGV